jgi:hypothetical protein
MRAVGLPVASPVASQCSRPTIALIHSHPALLPP